MIDRRDEAAWHLDKRVNIGHLAATLTLAVAIVGWGAAIDRRLAVSEEKLAAMQLDQGKQDARLESVVIQLRDDMKEMIRKLDRLVEARR